MREGNIRIIFESHMKDAGGDIQEGQKRTGEQIGRLIDEDKIKSEEFSLRALFEALVNQDRQLNLNDNKQIIEAMTASSFPYITEKLVSKTVIQAYNYALGDVGTLVHEVESSKRNEDIPGLYAGKGFDEVGEEQPYTEIHYGEKRCRIANHKYGGIVALTKEMILFDKTGMVLQKAKDIGEKGGLHRHRFIVQKACSLACTATGEAADKSLVIDGTARALFADDHSAWDDQTNDNVDTTAFGFSGVDTLVQLLAQQKDKKGDEIVIIARQILVPPQLATKANQIVMSDWEYGTGNRNANPFKGRFQIVSTPILAGSAGIYYIGDFPKQTRWQWVWKPTIETLISNSESAFHTDVLQKHKYSYMGGCGALDHRYVAKGGS